MTVSDPRKMLKQLESKPEKYKKFLKFNMKKERSTGITTRKCVMCGKSRAHINKYGLHLCRHCFRDIAKKIGFKKYS